MTTSIFGGLVNRVAQKVSPTPTRTTNPTVVRAANRRLAAENMGPNDIADAAAASYLRSTGEVPNATNISRVRNNRINSIVASQKAAAAPRPAAPANTKRVTTPSSGGSRISFGGGGRGGGGGGGAAAAPKMSQAQLDWAASLINAARPEAGTFSALDLPNYEGMNIAPFDPTMYNTARTAWNQGVQSDTAAAQQATQTMLDYLNNNYTNAFNNPLNTYATAGQAPGMDQGAMARLLQSQGVSPDAMAATANQGVQADQAFGNLWRTLAGNEDIAQRQRLANAQQYGTQAQQGITAAGRAGSLGLDLGQAAAQQAWAQRDEERRNQNYQLQQQLLQQEAMSNWQRQNELSDTNLTNRNQYENATMQAMLGLLPQLVGNPLTLPTAQALGLA